MKIKFIIILVATLIISNVKGQNFFVLLHDSNVVKSQCYLTVCSDQLSTGLVKVSDMKFDSITINSSKIIPLQSKGLSWDLLFFKFRVNTTGRDSVDYIFCFNQKLRVYYKIGGFQSNDYYTLFSYLKEDGMKLNKNNFQKEKVSVEGIDMFCLLDFYRKKLKETNKTITDADRQRYKCLQHYYGVIIIN